MAVSLCPNGRYRTESWPTPGAGFPGWQKKMNRGNDYLINRDKQKSFEIYAGVDARNHTQDAMITENLGPTMGPGNIVDRTQFHLGVSDGLVYASARMLLEAARDVLEGRDPPGVAFKSEDTPGISEGRSRCEWATTGGTSSGHSKLRSGKSGAP